MSPEKAVVHTPLVGQDYWAQFLSFALPTSRRLKFILDAGCGTGRLTQDLRRHADTVVGVDVEPYFDPNLDGIEFVEGDLRLRSTAWRDRCDLIVSYYVAQHLETFDDLCHYFSNLASYLTGGGRLCIAVPHPCFLERYRLQQEMMEFSDEHYLTMGSRYRTHIVGLDEEAHTFHEHHFPLSAYVNAASATLNLSRMLEPVATSTDDQNPIIRTLPLSLFLEYERRAQGI